jgi:putative cell surface protein
MKNVINKIIVTLFAITLVTTVFNILPKSLANSNGDYTYDVRDDGTIEITKYNGSTSNLNIPSTIDGKQVSYIGSDSFRGNKYLNSVTIPDSVKVIQSRAFAECSNLSTLKFGKNVEKIYDYVFFQTNITEITLPEKLNHISGIAFLGNFVIKNINVDTKNTNFSSSNGIVFSKDKKKIVLYPQGKTEKAYTIPSTVEEICDSAFSYAQVESITIPSSVKKFGNYVFSSTNITSITIPSTVTEMGYGPVADCQKLISANIQSTVKVLPYDMFNGCTSLKNVTLNDNIEEIYNRAFYGCKSLSNITLPKNLKKIDAGSFYDCSKLNNIKIPSGVRYISNSAFNNNTTLDISATKLEKLEDGSYRVLTTIKIDGYFDYQKANEVLTIVNKERANNGLSALKMDRSLLETAMQRAAESSIYWDHIRPDGSYCFTANSKMTRENIAYGAWTAEQVMNMWMNSSGHKANILSSDSKSIGIGCFNYNGVNYWVQCFGEDEAEGTTITENKNATSKISIEADYVDLRLERSSMELKIGESQYNVIENYECSYGLQLVKLNADSAIWKSSNEKIATVDDYGNVKGITHGKVTISAIIGEMELTYEVTIKLPFDDVNENDWFYNAVKYTYCNKIMSGLNGNTFSPNTKVTRGMLVTILYNLEGHPSITGTSKFADVQNKNIYFYNAVVWASNNNVVSGYANGKFGPDDNITREQLATILYNYCRYKGKYKTVHADYSKFTDNNKISDFAKWGMNWAVGNQIVNGSNGKLNPQGTATRAEAAAMISNYCSKIK